MKFGRNFGIGLNFEKFRTRIELGEFWDSLIIKNFTGRLYAVGPNLLAAVKLWLYRRVGSQTLHTRKCFATISDISLNWNIIIERVTYELRERETRCNARTLNTGKKAHI